MSRLHEAISKARELTGDLEKGGNKKKKKISMNFSDFIKEHKKLLQVLRSPSHEDDLEEAKEQADEVKQYTKKK